MNLCEMQDLLQNNFVGLAIPKCSMYSALALGRRT